MPQQPVQSRTAQDQYEQFWEHLAHRVRVAPRPHEPTSRETPLNKDCSHGPFFVREGSGAPVTNCAIGLTPSGLILICYTVAEARSTDETTPHRAWDSSAKRRRPLPTTTSRIAPWLKSYLLGVVRGAAGSLQLLNVVRCQLRVINFDRHLFDFPGERERYIVVTVVYR